MKTELARLFKLQEMMLVELDKLEKSKSYRDSDSFQKLYKKLRKSVRSINITLNKMRFLDERVLPCGLVCELGWLERQEEPTRDLPERPDIDRHSVQLIFKMPQCLGPTETFGSVYDRPFVKTTADNMEMAKIYLNECIYDSGVSFDDWLADQGVEK